MDEYEGFTLQDAEIIQSVYACSQCEGELAIIPDFFDNDNWLVICPEHGNIEIIGRISKTTVAIRNERGVFDFPKAIRALPDLWGELIPNTESREKIIRSLGF
jgi:hypothetical protein